MLEEKGSDNYKPPSNFDMTQRQSSPSRLIKTMDTLKSTTSTTSGLGGENSAKLRNNSTHSMIQRPELALYDTREIDFDEVNRININNEDEGGGGGGVDDDEEEEVEYEAGGGHRGGGEDEDEDEDDSGSWNHNKAKRPRAGGDDDDNDDRDYDGREDESSEDSGGFRKPVDFGIDKETSAKLDKLNVMLMVAGKDSSASGAQPVVVPPLISSTSNPNQHGVDSAPSTSREQLDSPTRNHVKNILGQQKYGNYY